MTVQAGIDERIRELVGQHRPELEQLVDQALTREIEALVAARLAGTNGVHEAKRETTNGGARLAPTAEAMKTCTGPCGRTLPTSAFDKYRRACKDCRRVEMRERAQQGARQHGQPVDAEEPPRTDTAAEDPLPVT